MQPRLLLLAALALLASACGPTIIGPSTPPEDAAADTSLPPPTDVSSPPPLVDVPVPPSRDVPSPPPIDVGRPDVSPPPPGAFLRACLAFCARGNVVCMTTLDCNRQCETAAAQREVQQCTAEVLAYLACAQSRSAYTCQRDRNTFDVDASRCAAEGTAFNTCVRGNPPPFDAGPPPIDVLPPPPDAPSPIFVACQRACERQARDCATGARCGIDCASVESSVPARCVSLALRALECFASNGFVCSMGGASPSPTCRAISEEVGRCIDGSPPPPIDGGPMPVDASLPPPPDAPMPVTRACAEACSLARRACMNDQPSCETGCSSVPSMLPPACVESWNTYLACVVRNGFTCVGGSARASTLCDSAQATLNRCAMGMTTPGDAGVAPPPDV